MGGDAFDEAGKVFHVHFDGADGKCQIRGLLTDRCNVLLEWDLQVAE